MTIVLWIFKSWRRFKVVREGTLSGGNPKVVLVFITFHFFALACPKSFFWALFIIVQEFCQKFSYICNIFFTQIFFSLNVIKQAPALRVDFDIFEHCFLWLRVKTTDNISNSQCKKSYKHLCYFILTKITALNLLFLSVPY